MSGQAPRSPLNPAMGMYPPGVPADPQQTGSQQYQGHMGNAVPEAGGGSGINGLAGQMGALSMIPPGIAPGGHYQAPLGVGYAFSDTQYYIASPVAGQTPTGIMDGGYGAAQYYAPAQAYTPNLVQYAQPMVPYTPGRSSYRSDRANRENIPPLDTGRRGSYSTNESTPATPFYNGMANKENVPRVSIVGLDRSTYTTPSPHQTALASLGSDHTVLAKSASSPLDARDLDELLKRDPAIPKAIPAVFTQPNQIKSLEQSLENRIPGNRNVYIRGLHPTTDDTLLLKYAERFGEVETSKAIIDTSTGACKGFGFAKFADSEDSRKCIAGFYRLGYEVGFARESFNSRLKAEGDESSTNLYISNLPRHMTEVELGHVFQDYTILSSKILRDNMGNSRGVGFARFETRDICDEVIKNFNGVSLPDPTNPQGNTLLLNIRYADTPAQKELKRVTAERRQFRTNEYNIGAYGTPHVSLQPHAYGMASPFRRSYPPIHNNRSIVGMNDRLRYSGDRSSSSEVGQLPTETHTIAYETPSPSDTDDGGQDIVEAAKTDDDGESSPSAKEDAVTEESIVKSESTTKTEQE